MRDVFVCSFYRLVWRGCLGVRSESPEGRFGLQERSFWQFSSFVRSAVRERDRTNE
jgi:hypothetical protein